MKHVPMSNMFSISKVTNIVNMEDWIKKYHPFVQTMQEIMIQLGIVTNSHEDNSRNNMLLKQIALFYKFFYVKKPNPSSLEDCFAMVVNIPDDDMGRIEGFYIFLHEILDLIFLGNLWDETYYDSQDISTEDFLIPHNSLYSSNDDDDLYKDKYMFIKTMFNIQKLKTNSRLRLPQDQIILFLYIVFMNQLMKNYFVVVDFIHYLRIEYERKFKDILKWDQIPPQRLSEAIMSVTTRQDIVKSIIVSNESHPRQRTSLIMSKLQWLKEHILDPSTNDQWITMFLKAVTGSSVLQSNCQIILQPVLYHDNRYATTHTCFNTIDICCRTNDCPGLSPQEKRLMSPKEIFIKNITDGPIAYREHTLLA